ncbi:MAG TPA: hypothetical protein VMW83_16170 [Spirochaetia bacterium]|nr:hypothetical protein [Spirochaetia bacterium]
MAGFVGTLDLSSGTLHPIAIGMTSPAGLLFVPKTGSKQTYKTYILGNEAENDVPRGTPFVIEQMAGAGTAV